MDLNTIQLGKRVYNNTMTDYKNEDGTVKYTDEDGIKALCEKAFTTDGRVRTVEGFRDFNRLIVTVAEQEAQAKIKPIIDLIAHYEQVGVNDVKMYKVDQKAKVTMHLTASGAGVDFHRIAIGAKTRPAIGETHQFGVQYNISEMVSSPVNAFRNAVDLVVDQKVKYIFKQIMALSRKAIVDGTIPAKQHKEGTNLLFTDFKIIENSLIRYGNNVAPIMIADMSLIDSFAMKQMTTDLGISGKNGIMATDELRTQLLRELSISQISKTICIPTVNPFIDEANSKTELAINEGILIAGGNKSPFYITDFGAMRETTDLVPDIQGENVNMKIDCKMDITLFMGRAMGYIKDEAVL